MAAIRIASASPRRAQLLTELGIDFVVAPADIDERRHPPETPLTYVRRMALTKASVGVAQAPSDLSTAVLAADTIVVRGGRVLGKPIDESDAVGMLLDLSDLTHQVYTAVAIRRGVQQGFACVCTDVSFRSVSMQEARAYWSTGEPVDKAGGYGIQGAASKFVKKINGSYTNVVGLPLYETRCLLRALQVLV